MLDSFPDSQYTSPTTFEVQVIPDPCLAATLTIDPAIYAPAPYEYVLEQAPETRIFDQAHVTSSESVYPCPSTIEFDVTLRNGDPLAGGFLVTFNPATNEISVASSDRSDLDLSPVELSLRAKYEGVEFAYNGSLDFDVIIIDPCLDIVTVTPEAQTDPSAYDYSGQLVWSVDPHFSLDFTCEIVYSCATEASPNGSNICAIDSGADN